jgi:hypothetical protein
MKKITFLLLLISTFAFSQCPQPDISEWNMTSDGANFDGTNFSTVASYEVEYNLGSSFTPGDGTASTFTFNEFPATLTGLESSTLYYFTIRSVCSDGTVSEWTDNPANGDGPDPWQTTAGGGGADCPDEYELPIVWRDNFECHTPFAIDNIEGWTAIDNDGSAVYGANDVDFTNEAYFGSGIIWNNNEATSVGGADINGYSSYEGNQGLHFFAATSTLNDDWMIGPEFTISGVSSPSLSFWAKSLTDQWGLERFQIAIGSSTDPADFTVISAGSYEEAPTEWTQYEYDLSAYDGQTIRVGIHYVGYDSFVLQMDSFVVEGTLGLNNIQSLDMNIYPNPVNGNFVTIQTPINGVKYVEVFDITGKRLINTSLSADTLEVSSLSAGMYLIKVTVEGQSKTSKLIVR